MFGVILADIHKHTVEDINTLMVPVDGWLFAGSPTLACKAQWHSRNVFLTKSSPD